MTPAEHHMRGAIELACCNAPNGSIAREGRIFRWNAALTELRKARCLGCDSAHYMRCQCPSRAKGSLNVDNS